MDNREESELIEDLIITDDQLYFNNTFNLKALNETLERLTLVNFWNLYQAQRSRLKIERFDIPFEKFVSTFRLTGESTKGYYPKRYVAYVDYQFIEPELRKKYRNSDFYNKAVSQDTISDNPNIFRHNHMVFIDGEYIFTTEVYPLESKTGIIIDVESQKNPHGISFKQFQDYKMSNPTVTVLMVPNFHFVNAATNAYILNNCDYKIPISSIPGGENFTNNTMCFVNSIDGIARRYFEQRITCDIGNGIVNVDRGIVPGGDRYRFCFLTFDQLYAQVLLSADDRYFQIKTKMPCPTEQMIVFVRDEQGRFLFDREVKINMYYPNIYEVSGIKEGEIARVIVFQDEDTLTESEKYVNEVAKYEEYIAMLPQYKENSVPDVLKRYKPSSFVYSINDYTNSVYVPNTMNYKVQKLHKTIYENPWSLAVYLDLLNLPTDKFYLDMEKLDLSNRIRKNTNSENLDSGITNITFDEDRYVFAMNRHFVNTRSYGFRIFIDGLFQYEENYVILPGPNFYYIYIPTSLIKPDTVIEIERYKLFSFEKYSSTDSLEDPVIEIQMDDKEKVGYSREIYVVDVETRKYLSKEKDFRIEVLYGFAEKGEKWAEVPLGRNIPIENKFRVYLKNDYYLGRKLKIGISRTMTMVTGKNYHEEEDELHDFTIYKYSEVKMTNQGGYDVGGYRVFNNGKLLLPNQYFTSSARFQGGTDLIRTSCKLYEGDRFTMDRVPARFVVVYYQNEIDEYRKRGLVDTDGKLPLPVSLKWYDIYLNGVKLHKKNIEIISPTKFYVQGVDSRKHLMIVARNRDPEVFRLAEHDVNFDSKDWNNTIMDELMDGVSQLRLAIDRTKSIIDPNNETREIASNVCKNLDALMFFYEFFVYTFINANKKQITQEIKEVFPSLINEKGIMEIDPNSGCIKSPEIGGYLIKLIECNYTDERSGDMFTDENVSYDGLGLLQDRFAIRPLNTTNYEFGLPQEFMCDPETGEPAIVNDDGTVTTVSTLVRVKNFIEAFSNNITLYGMGKSDIYQVTFDDEFKVKVYHDGENVLSEDISTGIDIKKFAIGLDVTFLTKVGESKMLKIADVNPDVIITYKCGGSEKSISHKLNRLHNYAVDVNGETTITSIKLVGIPDNVKTFIHSLLMAF